MKFEITVKKEFDLKKLVVEAGVRYWEDSEVNGEDDESGDLIPCRKSDCWCPEIDIETGKILNWAQGKEAEIHYKVCDCGIYKLFDINGYEAISIDGYVPDTLCPKEQGYGDYIIMDINKDGFIKDWKFNISDFEKQGDY